MFERFVERRAEEALSDTPVVLIVGPRRAGKTTLVRKMGEAGRTYITLDDQTVLEAAQSDPAGFIRGLDRAIIDEIPARARPAAGDQEDGRRGLSPGPVPAYRLRQRADPAADRRQLGRADGDHPDAAAGKGRDRRPDADLSGAPFRREATEPEERDHRRRSRPARPARRLSRSDQPRQRTAAAGLGAVLSDLGPDPRSQGHRRVEKLTELPKFVRLLAEHSGQLVNYSQFGGSINVSHKTGQRYVGAARAGVPGLNGTALVHQCAEADRQDAEAAFPRFRPARRRRGLTFDRVKPIADLFGALLESFVFSEVLKLMTASDLRLTPIISATSRCARWTSCWSATTA